MAMTDPTVTLAARWIIGKTNFNHFTTARYGAAA